jgi:hypothetical protein
MDPTDRFGRFLNLNLKNRLFFLPEQSAVVDGLFGVITEDSRLLMSVIS